MNFHNPEQYEKPEWMEHAGALDIGATLGGTESLCCGFCEFDTTPPDYKDMAHHLADHAGVFRDQLNAIRIALEQERSE